MKATNPRIRFYRRWMNSPDYIRNHIYVEESDLEVLTDKTLEKKWFRERILSYRREIQAYIVKDRRFLTSLKPLAVELDASAIVKHMAKSGQVANVGPMAAVSGSIAQFLARDLLKRGYGQVIIENGGDIFITKQKKLRRIAIYAKDSKFTNRLSLLIRPNQTPCGICTSSATFGHSLSFGKADSVIIVAKDAGIADAAATATCNLVKSREDFNKAIKFAKKISGIHAALIILRDNFASWGAIEINFS